VALTDIRFGKYARRVVARVSAGGVPDIAEGLLARGLARPYDGGRRSGWCGRVGDR
jgi:endonuclease YncB( thermonuclease family)